MATQNLTPTDALRRVYSHAPASDALLECLTLSHSLFSKQWHFVAYHKPVTATTETGAAVVFEPFPFTIKLPASDAQGGQLLDIAVANYSGQLVVELEAANTKPAERIEVVLRVYLLSDLTAPQTLPIRLSLDSVGVSAQAISGQAGRSDFLNQPFPAEVYDAVRFPGLRR